MTGILAGLPIHWRYFVKRRLMQAVTQEGGGAAAVQAAWRDLLAELPYMQPRLAPLQAAE